MPIHNSYEAVEVSVEYLTAVVDTMVDGIDEGCVDMNMYQQRALPTLIRLCQSVIALHKEIQDKQIPYVID
jgi:hypothetical protein